MNVNLSWRDDAVVLAVEDFEDHGRRRDSSTRGGTDTSGYGLTGMAERAELLGGRLTAAPTEEGFRVELYAPLSRVPT